MTKILINQKLSTLIYKVSYPIKIQKI